MPEVRFLKHPLSTFRFLNMMFPLLFFSTGPRAGCNLGKELPPPRVKAGSTEGVTGCCMETERPTLPASSPSEQLSKNQKGNNPFDPFLKYGMAQKPGNGERGGKKNRKGERKTRGRPCLKGHSGSAIDPACLCIRGQGYLFCSG